MTKVRKTLVSSKLLILMLVAAAMGIVVVSTLVSTTSADHVNLITDGSFETAVTTNWTVAGTGVDQVGASV